MYMYTNFVVEKNIFTQSDFENISRFCMLLWLACIRTLLKTYENVIIANVWHINIYISTIISTVIKCTKKIEKEENMQLVNDPYGSTKKLEIVVVSRRGRWKVPLSCRKS